MADVIETIWADRDERTARQEDEETYQEWLAGQEQPSLPIMTFSQAFPLSPPDPIEQRSSNMETSSSSGATQWQPGMPEASSEPMPSSSSSSEPVPLPPKRAFKWGQCERVLRTRNGRERCKYARSPRIWQSGPRAGKMVLLCNGWKKFNIMGHRECWNEPPFPFSRFSELPLDVQEEHKDWHPQK